MTWRTILVFILFATLLTILVGWLTTAEVLPIQRTIHFTDSRRRFLHIWFSIAISVGLILPSLAWIVWIRHPQPRRILGLYLVVLLVQIETERICLRIGIPSLVVTIGTVYTAFRIYQLWQGQQLIHKEAESPRYPKLMNWLLRLLLLFWSINLTDLLVSAWRTVLIQS